jgi:hypothetical protein
MNAIKLFPLVMVISLVSASGLFAQSAEQPLSGPQEAPERWKFNFDSRQWQLGYQEATNQGAIREYVLQGQTVEAWSELVTSLFVARNDVSIQDLFGNIKDMLSQGCPSLSLSTIEQSASSIIFEWRHKGCQGFPPQHEIKRIVQDRAGILSLAYAAKTEELSEERRRSWISILRNATPTASSSQPTPTALEVPGVSLVNHAAALRKDALGNLGLFAQKEYGCGSVSVLDTKNERVDGEILVDGKGRLFSGVVSERWAVDMCGELRNLALVFRADGKGGSYVEIAKVESNK